ncbi:transposase [Flavobacterium sp. W22_SRS_FP1]|uniref:transposase n=1 Tax=Flavobacterium sp. W22_SRS_FP1 TaxID=3240276 RepID=UPI003F8FAC43
MHKSKKFMAKVEQWKEKDVLIYFLPPYSRELNLIEILWRIIKHQLLGFDAYKSFENFKEQLNFVLNNFGVKYDIKF